MKPLAAPDSSPLSSLENTIEQATGESVAAIRSEPLSDRRARIERQTGRPIQIISRFPFIGRGEVLRDRLVSGEQVNALVAKALGK